MIDVTRGHPFLVQLLCGEIVTLKNEQDLTVRRRARLADVDAAIPEALKSGSFFFLDIANHQVTKTAALLLRAIAREGERAVVPEDRLDSIFTGDLGAAISSLLRRDLIERVDGGYRVQVELVRRWFAEPA